MLLNERDHRPTHSPSAMCHRKADATAPVLDSTFSFAFFRQDKRYEDLSSTSGERSVTSPGLTAALAAVVPGSYLRGEREDAV